MKSKFVWGLFKSDGLFREEVLVCDLDKTCESGRTTVGQPEESG